MPAHIGITGDRNCSSDYICFTYCLECGQIQGKFPISQEAVEKNEDWVHCTEDDS